LNELFAAWVETVYHQRIHSETGQAPLTRFLAAGPPALPSPRQLREAFLWSHQRRVTKTATVSLFGNRYEVDAALIGRQVEVVFDPFDLTTLEVRYQGRSMGIAVPHRIGRHVHPDARPDLPPPATAPTGIDYLALVAARHHAELAVRINYTDLPSDLGHPDLRDHQIADRTGEQGQADRRDPVLAAKLASLRAKRHELASSELPGQLDLTVFAEQLTDHTHADDHNNEGPR